MMRDCAPAWHSGVRNTRLHIAPDKRPGTARSSSDPAWRSHRRAGSMEVDARKLDTDMPTPPPTLTTPRLVLRALELSDAPAIQAIFPQWQIVEFLANRVPWPYPEDGALAFVRDACLPAMARGTQWHWTIRRREEPEQLIGTINLLDEPGNNRGLWLDPQWQGRGLMQEACDVVTGYWFEVLQKPLLQVPKAVPNVRSVRLSERSGMRLVGSTMSDFVSGRFESQLWEMTREDWLQRKSRALSE